MQAMTETFTRGCLALLFVIHAAHCQSATFPANLVAFWPLNSNFGTRDAGPNGINGVYVDPSNGPMQYGNGATGGVNGSAIFSNGNYVYADDSRLNVGGGSFTYAFWVKLDAMTDAPLIEYSTVTTQYAHFWYYQSSLYANTMAESFNWRLGTTDLNWHFVAITYAKSTQQLMFYYDSSTSPAYTVSSSVSTQSRLFLGRRISSFDNKWLTGKMACVAVASAALDSTGLSTLKSACNYYTTRTTSTTTSTTTTTTTATMAIQQIDQNSCSTPPKIVFGEVYFTPGTQQLAFSCFPGYSVIGDNRINCTCGVWTIGGTCH